MNPYAIGQVCPVRLDELGDQFRRYRLRTPQAVQSMAQSLSAGASAHRLWRACVTKDLKCSTVSRAGRRPNKCAA